MRSFELIEHTADVRLRVKADSLSELFKGALEGMNTLLAPRGCPCKDPKIAEDFDLDSPDVTALLIDFLNEMLAFSHIHQALFCDITLEKLSQTTVTGQARGCPTDHFDEDIKAVTYHEAQVLMHDDGTYETMIVFDI